jgi:large subunit ribosomal protein L10
MKQYLVGMTALALSANDPVAPAKIMKEYAEKVESFEIKAGFVDGGLLDAAGVNELASIPSKEQLIVKMLGSLMSPLYGLAYVLQAKIDKENGGEEAAAPAEA